MTFENGVISGLLIRTYLNRININTGLSSSSIPIIGANAFAVASGSTT